jgi:hypothetical protein
MYKPESYKEWGVIAALIIAVIVICILFVLYRRRNNTIYTEQFYVPETTAEADSREQAKLMLFYHPQCPGCVDFMKSENWKSVSSTGIPVETVNVEVDPATATKYSIQETPTVLLCLGETVIKYDRTLPLTKFIENNLANH